MRDATVKDLIALVTGCRPCSVNFVLVDNAVFPQTTCSRSNWLLSASLPTAGDPAVRATSSWPLEALPRRAKDLFS